MSGENNKYWDFDSQSLYMNIKTILQTVGSLQNLGLILNPLKIFSVDTIVASVSDETMLFMRGFFDVVAASNIGIGFLLIVAVFNTINVGIIVDSGQPSPYWILLIANLVLGTYGLLKDKQWTASYYSSYPQRFPPFYRFYS